jgi:hypothetical protein
VFNTLEIAWLEIMCFSAPHLQPPSHRQLLDLLSRATNAESFCAILGAVQQWQSDSLGDLHHFSGVLQWAHDIVFEHIEACPQLVIDGTHGPLSSSQHADVAARSRDVFCIVRFVALLLRSSYNKSAFRSHAPLVCLLAARVDALADMAQLALCALVDPPTFYMAKDEEWQHASVLADPTLRDRLSTLAECWNGVGNRPSICLGSSAGPQAVQSRRKLDSCSQDDPYFTHSFTDVAMQTDEQLSDSGCAVHLVFVPGAGITSTSYSDEQDVLLKQHAALLRACADHAALVPATWMHGDERWKCLHVRDIRTLVAAVTGGATTCLSDTLVIPSASAITDALAHFGRVPVEARFALLTRVRAALCYKGSGHAAAGSAQTALATRRWGLQRKLSALAAALCCRQTPQSIQMLMVDNDVRCGEDAVGLAFWGAGQSADDFLLMTGVPVVQALQDERAAAAAASAAGAGANAVAAESWMRASLALFLALQPTSLQASAAAVVSAFANCSLTADSGDSSSVMSDDLTASAAAVAFHCGIVTEPGGAADQLYAGVLPPAPFSPLLRLLAACSRVTQQRHIDAFAVLPTRLPQDEHANSSLSGPWLTPLAEWYAPAALSWAAVITRLAGAQLLHSDGAALTEFVDQLVVLAASPHRTRAHVAVACAAGIALSTATEPQLRTGIAVAAALRDGSRLERLCSRLAKETDHHVRSCSLLLELDPSWGAPEVSYPELPASEAAEVVARAAAATAAAAPLSTLPATFGAATGLDLPFDLGAPALPAAPQPAAGAAARWQPPEPPAASKRFRRVLAPLPEYIRELVAILLDVVNDAVVCTENMSMTQVAAAAAAGSNLIRPLQPPAPPPAPLPSGSPLVPSRGDSSVSLSAGAGVASAAAAARSAQGSPRRASFSGAPAGRRDSAAAEASAAASTVSLALGRTLLHPVDDFSEHFASDSPLTWVIKDILAYPEAFGGSLVHVSLALVAEIVHSDPSLCAVAFDCGITSMALRLLLLRALPPHPQLLTVMPVVLSGLLLTDTAKERIRQFEIAALVPPEPLPLPPVPAGAGLSAPSRSFPAPSPLLAAIAVGKSPAMSPLNPFAQGGAAPPLRRRSSVLSGSSVLAIVSTAIPGGGDADLAAAAPSSSPPGADAQGAPQTVEAPPAAGSSVASSSAAAASSSGAPPVPPPPVAPFPGSMEWAVLYGDRTWSAFALVQLAAVATQHALGPDFDAQRWQRMKSHERIISACVIALVDAVAFGPLPSLSVLESPTLLTSATQFDPRHPFCQGLRLAVKNGVPVFMHTNTDLFHSARHPSSFVDVEGDKVSTSVCYRPRPFCSCRSMFLHWPGAYRCRFRAPLKSLGHLVTCGDSDAFSPPTQMGVQELR